MNNDILFLSILFPGEACAQGKYVKLPRAQNISALQIELLKGIMANEANQCSVLNTLLVSLFPKGYMRPFVTGEKLSIPGVKSGYCHPFINVRGIYSASLFYGAKKYLKRWAQAKDGAENRIAMAYSLTTYTLKAMRYLKNVDPTIKTVIIVPDLPQYTYGEASSRIGQVRIRLAKHRVKHNINRLFPYVDKAILFAEKMTEEIDCADRSMVFEGLATDKFLKIDAQRAVPEENIKEILYAGGLNKSYGIGMLLDAFGLLQDERYRLVLAGTGPMQDEVISRAKEDPRIICLGEIPRERLLALEKGADVLVNPRVNSGIFTRYSFPSKNMEYLSAGTPMIGYKLDGIPDCYDDYINYFEEETAQALANMIERVCLSERERAQARAVAGQKFVFQCKNRDFWAEEILRFVVENKKE